MKRVFTIIIDKDGSLTKYFSREAGLMFNATSCGIIEMLRIICQFCADLIWLSKNGKSLIHIAIKHRQENVFNFLSEKNARNKIHSDRSIKSGPILHLAAKLAPFPQLSSVSGMALQMQRELQWFKVLYLC